MLLQLLIIGCWTPSTLKNPVTLKRGESVVGFGVNLHSIKDLKTGQIAYDIYTRRHLCQNTEFGVKVTGIPFVSGAIYGDIKHAFISGRINLTGDLEVSYGTGGKREDIFRC